MRIRLSPQPTARKVGRPREPSVPLWNATGHSIFPSPSTLRICLFSALRWWPCPLLFVCSCVHVVTRGRHRCLPHLLLTFLKDKFHRYLLTCVHACQMAHVWRELGKAYRSQFSHVWVLGIELRSLGLGQASFTG